MAVAAARCSAHRNAVSLQSGFSETLSNGGGGGGWIKPNPQHRLSIKPSEFTASPDTVNTRCRGPDPAFPLRAPAGRESSLPLLVLWHRGALRAGLCIIHHLSKGREMQVMLRWALSPRAAPPRACRDGEVVGE